jgi:hypothetical protein
LRSQEASSDDEVGHRLLCDALVGTSITKSHGYVGYYDKDGEIGRELLRGSQSLVANVGEAHRTKAATALQTRALFRSRMAYQSKLLGALGMIPLSAPLLPRPAVFLDYVPWIRYMLEAEEQSERQGRLTANSLRSQRWVSISEQDQRALESTALRGL